MLNEILISNIAIKLEEMIENCWGFVEHQTFWLLRDFVWFSLLIMVSNHLKFNVPKL